MAAETGAASSPSPFRFVRRVATRFHDLDAMGHAHHTLPLIYLEEARAAYWREVAGRPTVDAIDYVMAEVTVRFHGRIGYPETLEVALRVSRIGNKSFEMEFDIRSENGERKASGRTVQVMYDYGGESAMPVPAELRERIERFEGGTLSGG